MSQASFPSTTLCPKMSTRFHMKTQVTTPITCGTRYAHLPSLSLKPAHRNLLPIDHASLVFQSPISNQLLFQKKISSRTVCVSVEPHDSRGLGAGEEDRRALDAVLKLYKAIKNRNLEELSAVIGDECRCVCNFVSLFPSCQGKKQVMELFSFLMRFMGDHIEFILEPKIQDGMNVGVGWTLVWEKTHVPLGKGFSFYVCHNYKGKVMIRNIGMFMELFDMPLLLKPLGNLAPAFGAQVLIIKEKRKFIYFSLALLCVIILLLLLKHSR